MSDKTVYYPLSANEKLKQQLAGMTVNERLFATEQMEAFDKAEKENDKETVQKY